MHFTVKLDCKVGDPRALMEHHGALQMAFHMYTAYIASKEILIGTGPELYAEQWLYNCIQRPSRRFEDLILVYFTKILLKAPQK